MRRPAFTVLTPAYNSAHSIRRVYDSLVGQTLQAFEWIVVDDGSTDDLESLVRNWAAHSAFPIRYHRFRDNLGKPAAVNWGVSRAEGIYTLIADADDWFVSHALETFKRAYESLPANVRDTVHGVTCNCVDENGEMVGGSFPRSPWIADVFEMRYGHRITGEKWGFHRTDILKAFPFDTSIGRFVSEDTVWYAIAARYKSVFINEAHEPGGGCLVQPKSYSANTFGDREEISVL